MRSPGLAVIATLALACGCAQLVGTGWTPKGRGSADESGGAGSVASTGGGADPGAGGVLSSTTSTAASSTASSSTVSSSTASSSASGGTCASPASCPGTDGTCVFRTCVAGNCGIGLAPMRAPCSEMSGHVCDGAGNCVACVADPDCPGMGAHCVAGACQSCDDGVQNGNETDVDCGGQCQKCSLGQHCLMNGDCGPQLDCENGTCTEHG